MNSETMMQPQNFAMNKGLEATKAVNSTIELLDH